MKIFNLECRHGFKLESLEATFWLENFLYNPLKRKMIQVDTTRHIKNYAQLMVLLFLEDLVIGALKEKYLQSIGLELITNHFWAFVLECNYQLLNFVEMF